MALVVDTDVLSYLFKGDTRGNLYRPHLAGHVLVASFMTLAELDRWALTHHWGKARIRRMERYLANRYVIRHSERALCTTWAKVTHMTESRGRPIQAADAWIAATALTLDVPLVTHNAADFQGVPGLTVITEPGP